jgi:toxin ParE1/3/4
VVPPILLGHQFTEVADKDVEDILRDSGRQFGPRQQGLYAALIDKAAAMAAEAPERPGSVGRPELSEGVRSFHLELAARRRGAASHILYYRRGHLNDGSEGVIILRVLHERMEPARGVARGLGLG